MKVIGLIGPKSSGKDTSYDLLKKLKRVDGKISFAGPLKQICGEVFDLHFNLLNDPDLKEKALPTPIKLTRKHIRRIIEACTTYVNPVTLEGRVLYRGDAVSVIGLEGREFKTPRELMQIIGTELIRDRIYKPFHREAAFSEKALAKLKKSGTYAVTDVRFMDEHEFLQEKFGNAYQAFYVSRPAADELLAKATHPSELETQKIRAILADRVIDNSGTLEDLELLLKEAELGTEVTEEETSPVPGSRFRFAPKGQ